MNLRLFIIHKVALSKKGGIFLNNVIYRTFYKEDCQEVLEFWSGIPGIHLHNNGEDSIDGINAYLERNPGCSFVAIFNNRKETGLITTTLCLTL